MSTDVAGWIVAKAEPSDAFESLGADAWGLLSALDEKLHALAGGAKQASSDFMSWLRALKASASALLFHGGEIVSDDTASLKVVVIGTDPYFGLRMPDHRPKVSFMDVQFNSYDGLCMRALSKEGGATRSLLSSELLVLHNSTYDGALWDNCRLGARTIFDQHPLEDLAPLIAFDVKAHAIQNSMDFDVPDLIGGKKASRCISEDDFSALARRAMKVRRVPKELQPMVMDKTKRAFSTI